MTMLGEHGDGNRQWIETSQRCRSPHVKQYGSNARCLLGFLATHDCFSLFFLHMHVALKNFIVLFGEISPDKKGLDSSCVLHRSCHTAYLARSKYGNKFF
jgi:hypothetical protein